MGPNDRNVNVNEKLIKKSVHPVRSSEDTKNTIQTYENLVFSVVVGWNVVFQIPIHLMQSCSGATGTYYKTKAKP